MENNQVTTPASGFHYFPSPEAEDDDEQNAYTFLYCHQRVNEWPRFRRNWLKRGASREQFDHIEKNAIEIFREVRDTIPRAIDTGDMALISQPRLLQRLARAHAFLALYANPGAMQEYLPMIESEIGSPSPNFRTSPADFEKALREGSWNQREGPMPAEVTQKTATKHRRVREHDGKYNSRRRLDPAAFAARLENVRKPTAEDDSHRAIGPLAKEEERRVERKRPAAIVQVVAVRRGRSAICMENL